MLDERTTAGRMAIALQEARAAADQDEVPVGAVLFDRDGRELARAHNAPISLRDPTAHAEVLVLRRAAQRLGAYRLPGTILYVTLEPCLQCAGALLHARVDRVVYAAADPKGGAFGSVIDVRAVPELNHSLEVVGGVAADEAAGLLRGFFAARR